MDISVSTLLKLFLLDNDKNDKNIIFLKIFTSLFQKPREEKILVSTETKWTVARYDSKHGVQCPEFDSTGQFVYPPDCKFFVNCWKGRAFVQACAPGTLFNPNTLECDFPQKVKCYGEEINNYYNFPTTERLDSSRLQV